MANLDTSVYDLETMDGQQQAIEAIIQEQNNQFDNSQTMKSYQVSGYCQMTVTLTNGQPSGTYTTKFTHGMGFAPVVIAFFLQPQETDFYAPFPYNEAQFDNPPGLANSYQYFTVDTTNLYFNVLAVNNGGSFSSTEFKGSFYIFNIPTQVYDL